jgi:capsular polysaccharide biosynthesis protein
MKDENIELIDYFHVIWKWKRMIILVTFFCMVAAGLVSIILPKVYESSINIKIAMVAGNLIDTVPNIKALIASNAFLKVIIRENNLDMKPEELNIKFLADPNAYILIISLESKNPEMGKRLLKSTFNKLKSLYQEKFDEAYKINLSMEEDLKIQIERINIEINHLKYSIETIQNKPNIDAPAVILLEANLNGREYQLSDLKRRYRDFKDANSSLKTEDFKQIGEIFHSEDPIKSQILQNIIIAGFAGFTLTIILAFLVNYVRQSTQKRN